MARERWIADGYELTRLDKSMDVETLDGAYSPAAVEGENTIVPGRDGELWTPKRYGAGGFSLGIWIIGDTREAALAQWALLIRRVSKKHTLVRWEHHHPSGQVRECFGELSGRVAPAPVGTRMWRASLEVSVPSGVWQDTAEVDTGLITLGAGGALNRLVNLTALTGASAPMQRLRYILTGSLTSPRVTCPESGVAFTYPSLATGASLTVNAATDVVTAPAVGNFLYTGGPMMEVMHASDPAVAPVIQVTASSSTSAATLRVSGRRCYAV